MGTLSGKRSVARPAPLPPLRAISALPSPFPPLRAVSVLPPLRSRGALSALLAVVGTLTLAACGGDDRAAADTEPGAEAAELALPLDTDVLLADLHWEGSGPPAIGRPRNVTRRPDYDNQPHFLPDDSGFWYTVNDPHTGQADIYRYDLDAETVSRVTMSSPESEYSATPLPDGTGISVVRVEADSTQRLWRFDADGSNAEVLLEDVEPVGYHAWIDQSTVAIFVLGDPPTLRLADLRTGQARVIAEDIGRSLQRVPDGPDVSFVQRHADGTSTIMRLPGDGGDPQPIIETVGGGDFHAWAPDGTLLMAEGGVIHAAPPATPREWAPIADFSELNITITRLAVSPDASHIAMVAELAPLEGFPSN